MSVPEWVRRKSGTMFNCHPPFALETAASTIDTNSPISRIQTPPIASYREYPVHSVSTEVARRASFADLTTRSPVNDDVAVEDEDGFRKEEVAAALYSSPKLTATAPARQDPVHAEKTIWGDEYVDQDSEVEEEEEGIRARHPSLPDLIANDRHASSTSPPPSSPAVSHHEAITPSLEMPQPLLPHHGHDAKRLHCPHCGVKLMVIVEADEEDDEDELPERRACACERSKPRFEVAKERVWDGIERDGPVQVRRGAW